jgi:hypothetical protein
MTETMENENGGFLQSKFNRVFLTLITMVLLFAGPTYVPYALSQVIIVDNFITLAVGGLFFALGLVLLIYLVKKKVFT